jgi:hypothetical protein
MKIKMTMISELEVEARKLKQIENINVDDIFKNGKCTTVMTNISMDKADDVDFDRIIEMKILSVLWDVKEA